MKRVSGQPLLARVGEQRAGFALGRGVATCRALARRHGIAVNSPPLWHALVGAIRTAESVAAGVTEDSLRQLESDLVRFADFARVSASLWRLRHLNSFLPVIEELLASDDPVYAHDEYVLFLASQLFAAQLRPEAPRHTHATTLDLEIPSAFKRGSSSLFVEAKERDPLASRAPDELARYIAGKLAKARGQVASAGARGIAAIDLGLVDPASTPAERSILPAVQRSLAVGPLIGAIVSHTAALYDEATSAFVPSFRSWLYLSRRVLRHRAEPLRTAVLTRLKMAFPYGHDV